MLLWTSRGHHHLKELQPCHSSGYYDINHNNSYGAYADDHSCYGWVVLIYWKDLERGLCISSTSGPKTKIEARLLSDLSGFQPKDLVWLSTSNPYLKASSWFMRPIRNPVTNQTGDLLFDSYRHYHHHLAILENLQFYLSEGLGPMWRLIEIRVINPICKWPLCLQAFIPTKQEPHMIIDWGQRWTD